jgi:hypothetical protein
MRKIIGIILLIGLLFVGCPQPDTSDNPETIILNNLSIKTTGIKSLYVSTIPVNDSSRAAGDDSVIQTLSYINNAGQNTPFFFVSPSGKNIVLNVSNLRQLDDKRILVDFISFYEIKSEGNVYTVNETISNSGRALIDMENRKMYDFKDYNGVQFVSNDLLFTLEGSTLYKIDLNNISTAIPLNNPTYNPVGQLDPPLVITDKILVSDNSFYSIQQSNRYSIDINTTIPIKQVKNVYLTKDICSFTPDTSNIPNPAGIKALFYRTHSLIDDNGSLSNSIIIKDHSGSLWFYYSNANASGIDVSIYTYQSIAVGGENYFVGKLSVDNEGNILLSDYYESSLTFKPDTLTKCSMFLLDKSNTGKMENIGDTEYYNNNGMTITFVNGLITFRKKVSGIDIQSIALSIPVLNKNSSFINKDNYLYYLEGSSIKRLYLATGETPETVYNNSRLLTGGTNQSYLTATGSNLVFYQFADDNISVNTYSIPMYQPGATPKLLSTNSADIKSIVELDF